MGGASSYAAFVCSRTVEVSTAAGSAAARPAFVRLTTELARRGTEVLLVLRDGELLYEWYAPKPRLLPAAEGRRSLASMAKGVLGGLGLARLAQDGLIELDDPIGQHVPEWRDDPERRNLTLRQLASHSAGLRSARTKDDQDWAREYMGNHDRRVELALQTPVSDAPGRAVDYSNPSFTILGYALSRAAWESGQGDLREHLRRELMRPLGIPDGAWSMGYGKAMPWDGVPVYDLAGGGQATGRALAVLGAMVTAGGRRDGANVLARHWIEEIATATTASLPSDWRERRQPAAGLGWWLNRNGVWPEAPPDTMVAAGSGHQLLVAVPSIGLTVVRLGGKLGEDTFGGDFWQAFEQALLNPLLDVLRTEHLFTGLGESAKRAKPRPTGSKLAAACSPS